MNEIDYPYSWTQEDTRTCDALVRSGHMTYQQPVTVLGIVNAARAYERERINDILDKQPAWVRASLTDVMVWLDNGAPDLADIQEEPGGAG